MPGLTRDRSRVLAALTLSFFTACSSDSSSVSGRRLPSPTASAKVEEVGGDRFRVWPVSVPAADDESYEFTIYTHCGVAQSVIDFDGSMWDYDGPKSSTAGLGNPDAEGTIRLTGKDTAEFTAEDGTRIELTRVNGPKIVPGCE